LKWNRPELGSFLDEIPVEPYDEKHRETLPIGSVGLMKMGVVTLFGVKTTMDEAMFVDEETAGTERRTADVLFAGKRRYLVHARKIKGIVRRSHREIAKQGFGPYDWVGKSCKFPDEPCTKCVDCFEYGGLLPEQMFRTNARVRFQDLISVQDYTRKISFRARHPDEGDPTPFQEVVVPPGTNLVYPVYIAAPTLSTVAGFLAADRLADAHGYGNYTSVRGRCKTEWLMIADGLPKVNKHDAIAAAGRSEDAVEAIRTYLQGMSGKRFVEDPQGTADKLVDWFSGLFAKEGT